MKRTALILSFAILAAPLALLAQSSSFSNTLVAAESSPTGAGVTAVSQVSHPPTSIKPFSRIAFGGGVSLMGVNMQVATNVNRFMNLRATGNYLKYDVNNISTNGFNIDADLNMATAGVGVDIYPFPRHGFRLSPGVLLRNENTVAATMNVTGGTKLSLNNVDYYSSTSTPIIGSGNVGLNTNKQAFTMTTGWGNMISRTGGHWSFPLEIGAAMVGSPSINLNLTSGQACNSVGANCVNVATDPTVNANLQAQIAKYKSDLDPLKYYPIFSFGVSYSFRVR